MWKLEFIRNWCVLKWVILIVFSILLWGCATTSEHIDYEKEAQNVHKLLENQNFSKKVSSPKLNKKKVLIQLEPIAKEEVNPLKRPITIAFDNLEYEKVFYFLAFQSGLNLMLDPDLSQIISPKKEKITFTFKEMPLEVIIKKICELLDVDYHIDKGVLYIKPYTEKFISLDFLPFVKQSSLNIGGDVLGGGSAQEGISNPLTGQFTITGSMEKESLDIYTQLSQAIKKMLSKNGFFIINKTAGILYIKDRPSRVKTIVEYIEKLKKRYLKQAILDVKIVEVTLFKDINKGIDWLQLSDYLLSNNKISFDTLSSYFSTQSNSETPIRITITGHPQIQTVLNFLARYGKVKIVSNPKIRVLHSQPALISVGSSIAYVKRIEKEITSEEGATVTSMTIDTSSIFEGILLGITPYITEDGEVILQIIPIKSDILDLEKAQFEGGDYFVTLPKVNLREMSSIIKTRPGDLVVIGGLMLEKKGNNENRLEIPLLNKLFRKQKNYSSRTELVILIRVAVD